MGLTPRGLLEAGEPVDRIVAVVADVRADLVVVGHHRYGMIRRWLHPSVTAALSDRLPCSLLSARKEVGDDELFTATGATD